MQKKTKKKLSRFLHSFRGLISQRKVYFFHCFCTSSVNRLQTGYMQMRNIFFFFFSSFRRNYLQTSCLTLAFTSWCMWCNLSSHGRHFIVWTRFHFLHERIRVRFLSLMRVWVLCASNAIKFWPRCLTHCFCFSVVFNLDYLFRWFRSNPRGGGRDDAAANEMHSKCSDRRKKKKNFFVSPCKQ